MVHLRIVSPTDRTDAVIEALSGSAAVINIVRLDGVARRPDGDLVLCDVAREDASVVLADLRRLGIHRDGSIAVERVDSALSDAAEAAERAAEGAPSDAVVWEQLTEQTSEESALSAVFLVFMVLAAVIVAVGIMLDSPILIVGGMVVGPEFGPVAGFCVALVQRRGQLAVRSLVALGVGFPAAIAAAYLVIVVLRAVGALPDAFSAEDHNLARTIASPDLLAFVVAFSAGIVGMLSLTTSKSGALVGVLISVTTMPAAANVGLAAAYRDWSSFRGSAGQLALNLGSLLVAGTLTLLAQRAAYHRRAAAHRRAERGGAAADPDR